MRFEVKIWKDKGMNSSQKNAWKVFFVINSHSLGNKDFLTKKLAQSLRSLRIWDQIIATGFLLQAGWLLGDLLGPGHHCLPFLVVWQLEGRGWVPGFLEALKMNFGRELNGSPGEEVAWGRTFKTNRGGKWQGETWLWKVTWSWNSEWKFATFHGSFLWSRIFPSIGAPSNWYIYI